MCRLLFCLVSLVASVHSLSQAIAYIGESSNFQTNRVTGWVRFVQQNPTDDFVTVTGTISGLAPGDHGFHVHQFGDMRSTTDLDTLGTHFIVNCNDDPIQNISCTSDQQHGIPPAATRHPGDMGNINVNSNGVAVINKVLAQGKMSLSDVLRSVVGRTVLVHQGMDFGTQPYGNATGPEAFGVIGKENIASNGATAPNVPPVQAAIAVQTGLGSAGVGVNGVVWISKFDFSATNPTLKTDLLGLPAGQHAIGLYQFGQLTNDTMNYGNLIESVVVSSSGPTALRQTVTLAGTTVLSYVGTMAVIFSGGAVGTFQDALSMGVVGLANEGVDFLPATNAATVPMAAFSGAIFVLASLLFTH